ncbi:DNA-cytosine methyltransferase [Heyndrickxia coagulans]|nr:DNA-cytosine methyltransferase [Heyndrickxia coagulans]
MAKQNKAFKFRLLPNKEQSALLAKTFGCVRFVYNKMLAERKETYEKFKPGLALFLSCKQSMGLRWT